MPYFKDRADLVEPTAPTADGPPPALVTCPSVEKEFAFVLEQACAAAKTRNVAILFRKRSYESLLTGKLPPGSVRLHRKMTTWIAGPGLRYGTYHSAKGLEFDAVYLPFCSTESLPDPEEIDNFGDEEAAVEDGRLLYVGITRAKAQLVITYSGEPSDLLPSDATLYDRSSI
jgi:superfamily I DNA/RNA helicase